MLGTIYNSPLVFNICYFIIHAISLEKGSVRQAGCHSYGCAQCSDGTASCRLKMAAEKALKKWAIAVIFLKVSLVSLVLIFNKHLHTSH